MANFILNRPDDFETLSRGRIIGTTLKWFILLTVAAIVLRVVCVVIYTTQGVNPTELTKFGGDPTTFMGKATWKTIALLLIMAPVLEEVIFRLGLSFKRATVALWLGLLPVVYVFYMHHCRVWYILLALVFVGALLYWLVYHYTTDEQWKAWREKYIVPAMWVSAIGFGLIHLMAFTTLNWQVFPFALTTILVPMAGGCAFTYARVNLGFWWGVLFHSLFNVPAILTIVSAM